MGEAKGMEPEMDMLGRLGLMADNEDGDWDLSYNDKAALAWAHDKLCKLKVRRGHAKEREGICPHCGKNISTSPKCDLCGDTGRVAKMTNNSFYSEKCPNGCPEVSGKLSPVAPKEREGEAVRCAKECPGVLGSHMKITCGAKGLMPCGFQRLRTPTEAGDSAS